MARMPSDRQQAIAEFKRILKWIALIAVLMVAGALIYLRFTSTLDANTIIATTIGVFFSVLLGCGLFAAAFFSSKSGYDQNVTDVTRSERDKRH
jgi:predicted permease